MDLLPFLILPLVGGYAFSTTWTGSLYYSSRESGHRLYFRAIFYAFFLISVSFLLHVIFFVNSSYYCYLLQLLSEVLTTKEALTIWSVHSKLAILTMPIILGSLLGHLLNLPKNKYIINLEFTKKRYKPFFWWEKRLLNSAIKNIDFEKLIARSVYKNLPLLITLKTGKIYLGWAVRAPNPTEARKALRILPILSGYRQAETHKVFFTTDYYEVYSQIENIRNSDDGVFDHLVVGDFEVIIPSDQICSAHLFDLNVFNLFRKNNSATT